MSANIPAFLGVAAIVLITPGPDTALVTKNALIHGRRAAYGTSFGVAAGLLVWTLASALGIAAVVRASETAFTALKLVGAVYLIWLGIQALRASGHSLDRSAATGPAGRRVGAMRGLRQGLISNLANPKIAVFYTSFVPQFVGSSHDVLLPSLLLGCLFAAVAISWLCVYATVASKAGDLLTRPRVKATLDRITGCVLIGLGLRLATEHR